MASHSRATKLNRVVNRAIKTALFVLSMVVFSLNPAASVRAQAQATLANGRPGVSIQVTGQRVSMSQMIKASAAEIVPSQPKASPWHALPRKLQPTLAFPGQATASSQAPAIPARAGGPRSPQTVTDTITGPTFSDSSFVPPDTMGTVGPSQFFIALNGRFRVYDKASPHTVQIDVIDKTFWGSTANPAGVSDPHVRYDRTTGRWFVTQIDVPSTNNDILLAFSDTATLSSSTVWTKFALPGTGAAAAQDHGCFVDYDTPGIDQNAIYIGANIFCPNNYAHSNGYVVAKDSSLFLGTAHFTAFYNITNGFSGPGPYTPQGVDSVDASSVGYFIGPNLFSNGSTTSSLELMTVNNPGTVTPTISGPTAITMPLAEGGSLGGVIVPNGGIRPIDDLDDRLFAAVIRNGHLWTAHNVGVNSSGLASSPTRDSVRWYDIDMTSKTVNQSGTIYDNASSGFASFWMGTVMVSGQGHVAMGMNRGGSTLSPQDVVLGRLAGDPLNTMEPYTVFNNSASTTYNDSSFVSNPDDRWGDYSYTSLDPCDDMTMWTVQEYITSAVLIPPVGWGVMAAKLAAPPPATPASANPSSVDTGQSNVSVVITGTSTNGSGFYDTPSSLSSEACRKRITASVTGGVTVNSVTYTDPTHVTLNITTGSTTGVRTVTITNPDGQTASAGILTVGKASTTVLSSNNNPSVFGQAVTFTATVSGSGSTPTGDVTFKDGATTLGTGSVNGSGIATFLTSALTVGSHPITASYNGDGTFVASNGNLAGGQVVNKGNTSTAVGASKNPVTVGQPLTFTATVSVVSPASGTPAGTVTFFDGTTNLGSVPLSGSTAMFNTTASLPLSHSISAVYNGDANFNQSTSPLLGLIVKEIFVYEPMVTR